MRALQVTSLDGPDAVVVADVPEPEPGDGVLFEVRAAGVSFPDVLQARGQYQSAAPPYVPGVEAAGVVRAAPPGSPFAPGDRVAAMTQGGGWAELAVAAVDDTFPLADALDFAQGAGLVLNYHTAWFALVMRGRLRAGRRSSSTAPPAASGRRRCRWRAGSARARSPSCRPTRRSASRATPARTRCCAPTAPGARRRSS